MTNRAQVGAKRREPSRSIPKVFKSHLKWSVPSRMVGGAESEFGVKTVGLDIRAEMRGSASCCRTAIKIPFNPSYRLI
jgi:hypothetical protein